MPDERKRMLVFGGTFDPPHNGHIALVEGVLSRGLADEALFVPSLRPPHKPAGVRAGFEDRVAMLRLAVEDSAALASTTEINEIEAARPGSPSYTYDTMLELSSRLKSAELILLLGADSLMNLHTWSRAPDLIEKWRILTYPRGGLVRGSESVLKELMRHWPEETARSLADSLMELACVDVSSSGIRKFLAEGDLRSARRYLPPLVFEYIRKKGIYGNEV